MIEKRERINGIPLEGCLMEDLVRQLGVPDKYVRCHIENLYATFSLGNKQPLEATTERIVEFLRLKVTLKKT